MGREEGGGKVVESTRTASAVQWSICGDTFRAGLNQGLLEVDIAGERGISYVSAQENFELLFQQLISKMCHVILLTTRSPPPIDICSGDYRCVGGPRGCMLPWSPTGVKELLLSLVIESRSATFPPHIHSFAGVECCFYYCSRLIMHITAIQGLQ